MSKGEATAATLIVRIATLWFGVALGLAMFAILTHRLSRQGKKLEAVREPALTSEPDAVA